MKKENGITLIKFCIIIVICLVIMIICLINLIDTYKKSNLEKYISKMELIEEKVNWVRNEYKLWDNYNPNESGNFYAYLQSLGFSNANSSSNEYIDNFNEIIDELNSNDSEYWNKNIDSIIANYCYFTPDDLKNFFDLDNMDLYVIINFYTGNVISKDGIEDSGKIIYRQYDSSLGKKLIVSDIYNNNVIPKLEIIENYGLSQKVKIYFECENISEIANISEIYYFVDKEENKKLCSTLANYTYVPEEKAAYFTIETSGEYNFIIEDTNFVEYAEIKQKFKLCNPPILTDGMKGIYWDEENNEKEINSNYDSNWYNYSIDNLKMANAKTEDGNYWVWIPRYLYKETSEGVDLEFVYNETSISTTNKSMNGYKIQEAFDENGSIKGFWIAKFQVNTEDGMINIKPGQTLTILKKSNLKFNKFAKDYSLMSENERNAVLLFSESNEIEITNDLVYYAGGSPDINGYLSNEKYSSTNNVYGVYDLISSENELTSNSADNEEGRFRPVIVIK